MKFYALFMAVCLTSIPAFAKGSGSYTRLHCPFNKSCNLIERISAIGGQVDFIVISDYHPEPLIKTAMTNHEFLDDILNLGIKTYGIESAFTPEMQKFLKDYDNGMVTDLLKAPELIGPSNDDEENLMFANVVEQMHRQGFSVVPVDHPRTSQSVDYTKFPCSYSREMDITKNLMTARTNGPVLTLLGGRHSVPGIINYPTEKPVNSTVELLVAEGYHVLSIGFEGTYLVDNFLPPQLIENQMFFCEEDEGDFKSNNFFKH